MKRKFSKDGLLEVLTEAFGVAVPIVFVTLLIMSPLVGKIVAAVLIGGGILFFIGMVLWRAFDKIFPKKEK